MAIHQCPKCELRFERKTELDDHCWHDHAEFRHEYPATMPPPLPVPPVTPHPASAEIPHKRWGSLGGWLTPKESHDHEHPPAPQAENETSSEQT